MNARQVLKTSGKHCVLQSTQCSVVGGHAAAEEAQSVLAGQLNGWNGLNLTVEGPGFLPKRMRIAHCRASAGLMQ